MPYDEDGRYTPHQPYTIEHTFKLVGTCKGQTEDIETDIKDMKTAQSLLGEYEMAFGKDWTIVIEEE